MIPGATLPNTNETLSRKHLENVERKLSRNEMLKEEYNGVRAGVIEEALQNPSGERVFKVPHKPVVKLTAVTTKVHMVFDASASPLAHSILHYLYSPLQLGNPRTLMIRMWRINIPSS